MWVALSTAQSAILRNILDYNGRMQGNKVALDANALNALAKWPNVPDCFGWLSLDPRGRWRIQDELITHPRTITFINHNYRQDELGRSYVQNGPQLVFVDLEYTPWVYRLEHGDQLCAHTGKDGGMLNRLFIDETGSMIADATAGVGILHDSDLQTALARIWNSDGTRPGDEQLEIEFERLKKTGETALQFRWGTELLPIEVTDSHRLATQFGYVPRPR